jgi:hypothetical protein
MHEIIELFPAKVRLFLKKPYICSDDFNQQMSRSDEFFSSAAEWDHPVILN